jgi:hypothetical protein
MYHFSPRKFSMLAVMATLCMAATSQAQRMLAASSTLTQTSTTTASQNAAMRDEAPAKLITAQVRDGILTIDGMVAKVQLNYEIQRDGYLYFFVPGMGTAVLSLAPMPGAEKVHNAFDGQTLSFTAGGHSFELTSDRNLLARDKARTDAYVRLDTTAVAVGRYPRMGFGNTLEAPYAWPLSAPASRDKYAHNMMPPPVPANLLPRTVAEAVVPAKVAHTVQQ